MSDYQDMMREREAAELQRRGKEIKLRRRALSRRPKNPHFRWRVTRLYFCIGGESVAAWPSNDDWYTPRYKSLSGRERWKSDADFLERVFCGERSLPTTPRDIMRLVRLMRDALIRAEGTKRAASAKRQRARLERWLAGK